MSKCAERDDINTCFSNGTDILGGDISRCFEERTAIGDFNGFSHLVAVHVVKHDYLDLAVKGFLKLVKSADFDFYLYGMAYLFTESGNCGYYKGKEVIKVEA